MGSSNSHRQRRAAVKCYAAFFLLRALTTFCSIRTLSCICLLSAFLSNAAW